MMIMDKPQTSAHVGTPVEYRSRGLALMMLALALLAVPARGQATPVGRDSVTLWRIAELVSQHYWRPIARDSAFAIIRSSGLGALDPYSAVIPRTDWEFLTSALSNSFGGVGMMLEVDSATAETRVSGVLAGASALEAGLAKGDALLAIDGVSVRGRSLDDVVLSLRGVADTRVTLDVRRQGRHAPERLVLRRKRVQLPSVRGYSRPQSGAWRYRLDDDAEIAYIRIGGFVETTVSEIDSALATVSRSQARALVLDLRDSPGGLLQTAVQIADRFLDSGVVVSTRGRTPPDVVERATPGVATRLPLAILISDSTKSAAEILTSALQDNRRAMVVGTRSFGKGLVQRLFPLPDSAGGMTITIEAYLRPSGRPIERRAVGGDSALGGVWPDPGMTVPLTAEQGAALSNDLAQGDTLGTFASVEVRPTPSRDPVLARARAALRARLGGAR